MEDHANSTNPEPVQAYAKLTGADWTYYIKSLPVLIGRSSDANDEVGSPVHIDLSPQKIVSRRHGKIDFNSDTMRWELHVIGRNGIKVNGTLHRPPCEPLYLESRCVF